MAAPIIKLKRSAVAGKRPTLANLPLGEIALNTYDGKLFVRQDTSGVGIATTVRTVNPWSENFVSGGEHSIYYDGGDVGIGTDNPTNAALHVEGRNFAFGGPGDNESGAGNLYIGNFDNPLLDSYDRNVRIGSRNEIQVELYTSLNATEYADSIISSSTSGLAWQFNANNGNSTRSGAYPFYYSMGNAKTDDYIFLQAGDRYLWFDADTGRLGINRSSGSGWSDTLDVNGSAKVNGDLTVTGLSTLTNNVHIPNGAIGIGTDDTSLGKAVFYGTGNGNGQGPILSLVRDSATPASNDRLGTLQFYGKDSSDNTVKYKSVYVRIVDPTAGSVTGQLCIGTDTSTSGRQVIIDADGSVGIGTDDITEKLHVVGNVRSTGVITATSFYGDGSNLTGITADAAVGVQTSGGYVGSGVTAFSFEGTAVGDVTVPSSGISTININATTALSRTVTNVTPTQDQTDFTVSYQVGFIDVYLNGVLLSGSDFTATNGTSVSISTSLSTTDNVDFIAYEGVSAGVVDGVNRWTSVGSSIYNNNSGNVGIGTEKPNSKLQVFGGIVAGDATSGTSSSGFSIFRPYDSTPRTFAIVEDDTKLRIGGSAWDSINFRTAPSNNVRVAITSTGNVGLGGTEEPTQILQIAGNNSSRVIQYGDNSVGYFISRTDVNRGGANQALHIHDFRWNGTSVARIKGLTGNDTINKDNGSLTFETTNGAGLAERLRITSSGDVGIGTTFPSRKLHIYDASSDAQVRIQSFASGTDARLDLLANSTGVSQIRFGDEVSANVGTIVYTHSDDTLAFRTNSVNNRMLLDSSGNLGIGSAAPGSRLHVFSSDPEVILVERSNNANAAIQYTNTDGSMYAGLTSNAESWAVDDDNNLGTAPMFCVLRSNGNVGINSSIPGEALDVNGNVKAVDFNSTSDIKLKDKVRKISKPLSKLDKIRGVSFEWKETKQKSMGVVAQEVEKVIPDLVRGDETKTVNYNGLIGLLIECVKEQQIRIDQLEQKLGQL